MRGASRSRALGSLLIAAGIIVSAVSIYFDLPGGQEQQGALSHAQWLGVAFGFLIAFSGVLLRHREQIMARIGVLLAGAWAWAVQNWPVLLAVLLTVAVAYAALYLRLQNIAAALPYPGHIDEPHLSERAGEVIKTGRFDVQIFNYPHTPLYLVLGGLLVGYADAAMHLEVNNTQAIGSLGFPHFSVPRVIWPAKALFALLSVAAMVFIGIVGYRALGRRALLWLVPLVILFSETYFFYSHQYLNVDLVGAFFVAALYLYLFLNLDRDSILHKAIVPGFLCALAITSKYTLLWIVVPSILVIVLYSRGGYFAKILLLLVSVAISFVVLMPNVVPNATLFVDTIAGSMFHYARGHSGSEGEPGLFQFLYYLDRLVAAYGPATVLLAVLGCGAAFQRNWKGALVLVSFPTILLLYMSAQTARFVRNTVSLHLFYGLFVAVGILCVYDLASSLLQRLHAFKRSPWLRHVVVILAISILLAMLLPVRQLLAWADPRPDTRNLALAWIRENAPKGSTLLIAQELGMRTAPLDDDYRVVVVPWAGLSAESLRDQILELGNPYILMPAFGYDERKPKGKELAQRLNDLAVGVQILEEVPGNSVLVNYAEPVPWGDPQLVIGQLDQTLVPAARDYMVTDLDLTRMQGRKRVTADGSLRLPWNTSLRSPPVFLEEGRYEVVLVTKGTEANGEYAQFRVYLGDEDLVGEFFSQDSYEETRLSLEVAEAQEASLVVAFVNDAAERDEAGTVVADRNAWIQSIAIHRSEGEP